MSSKTEQGGNPKIDDILKIVNLGEESILVAKCTTKVPEGTKVKEIKVILDSDTEAGCAIQFNF
ncbi:MAG: hypothetical protein IM504_15550 [Microcystis sp. M038S2]|jgi:hypothetical protein|uniref:hypothetical protein n=1 Tax=unclassified Microcystis TaxID=2643300 RepID=UPI00258549A0|nr:MULTISPECIES: hypothetical protein [unclassified Microcystis]MCA2685047.1 hypothetical protein [Microcystis sp. M046S2]MCA2706208.1 hypothetical protein [Microcystis sp. M038S2]MCA2951925.1 hypothetical protein [Microcystis sp. M112S1]NCS48530.1 hypothetical protein [Microcystis aeruginosa BK11-02]